MQNLFWSMTVGLLVSVSKNMKSVFVLATAPDVEDVIMEYIELSPFQQRGVSQSLRYNSRILDATNRKKPGFGGRIGLADASNLSKHKNRIKNIGVQFFAEDALATYKQNQSWQERYEYDSSIGYHWFGKSDMGIGTMNIVVREYQGDNQTITTVIAGYVNIKLISKVILLQINRNKHDIFNLSPLSSAHTCRSVSDENYVYNFHTDEGGLIQVTAVSVANFPKEVEPIPDHNHQRFLSPLVSDSIHIHNTTNGHDRSLPEDGSLIDVICFYTRRALCLEANKATTCNLDEFKYLMDNKCSLAISETVSAILFNIYLPMCWYYSFSWLFVLPSIECRVSK